MDSMETGTAMVRAVSTNDHGDIIDDLLDNLSASHFSLHISYKTIHLVMRIKDNVLCAR